MRPACLLEEDSNPLVAKIQQMAGHIQEDRLHLMAFDSLLEGILEEDIATRDIRGLQIAIMDNPLVVASLVAASWVVAFAFIEDIVASLTFLAFAIELLHQHQCILWKEELNQLERSYS